MSVQPLYSDNSSDKDKEMEKSLKNFHKVDNIRERKVQVVGTVHALKNGDFFNNDCIGGAIMQFAG